MKKIFNFLLILFIFLFLNSCQAVSNKIDKNVEKEEKELSKWLNQPESELKIVFGSPDKIEFTDQGTRNYIYITEKLKIKCERKFEINSKNMIVGFSSKNCF
jgi:GTP-binding protein EngB required for normal cell division|tara:strand:- start:838 stop:1143 length:306 start_codon:yes stop_codon:yes gene_type:complete